MRAPIVFERSVDLTKGPGRLLCGHIHALASNLERIGASSRRTLLLHVLEDALISLILGLPGHHSHELEDQARHDLAPRVVRRAEEYMAAQAAYPITVSDVVATCGCSRSALYGAFKSERGYTPMQFLATRRLVIARKRLTLEPGTSVTEIALDCGFNNHGRFAKAYRSRFGESPSATRSRCFGSMRR